jgi:hypothetical protein
MLKRLWDTLAGTRQTETPGSSPLDQEIAELEARIARLESVLVSLPLSSSRRGPVAQAYANAYAKLQSLELRREKEKAHG